MMELSKPPRSSSAIPPSRAETTRWRAQQLSARQGYLRVSIACNHTEPHRIFMWEAVGRKATDKPHPANKVPHRGTLELCARQSSQRELLCSCPEKRRGWTGRCRNRDVRKVHDHGYDYSYRTTAITQVVKIREKRAHRL